MEDYNSVARSGAELVASLAETVTPPGHLAFWWCGQQTWLVKAGATKVFFDPYLKPGERRHKPPLLTPAQCAGLDVIACTHDHSDHIDPWAIPQLAALTRAVFVAPRALRDRMLSLEVPAERLVLLNPGESATLGDVSLTAVAGAHEFLDVTPDGLHPYLGYILRGNGACAYHAGDTVWWEGLQAALRAQMPLDVAFVPINGRDAERYRRNCIGNMGFAEAADLVCQLPVGLAVPAHFDMFDGNMEDPARFTDFVEAKYPGQRWWLGPAGEPVLVAAGGHVVS
jgi:L-ascorbate metabolism protein UlaG (beta-lactamase superfamily)